LNRNDHNVTLNIWDISGSKENGKIGHEYYSCADGAIVMFDNTSSSSFDNVTNWVNDLNRLCPDIPITICGTKSELEHVITSPQKYELSKKT